MSITALGLEPNVVKKVIDSSYKRTLSSIAPSSSLFAIVGYLLLLRRQESDLATTIATALYAGKNISHCVSSCLNLKGGNIERLSFPIPQSFDNINLTCYY